jgi:antitoxin component of MazEF toxin-antitoxin module
MLVHVKKWGNGASIPMPASIAPINRPFVDLEPLLDTMDPVTFHKGNDFGRPMGREVW